MHNNWETRHNALIHTFTFTDFSEALAFVNAVGKIAEELQHHPDILIANYNQVTLTLRTHDADAVTDKDYALAKRIDAECAR